MPLLRAAPVPVTDRERRQLKTLERQPTCPQQITMRARIILLARRDVGVRATVDELGIGRSTVQAWRRRWTENSDASVAIQSLERITPMQSMTSRRVERREFAYQRYGTHTLITGLNVATGNVARQLGQTRTEDDFARFLSPPFCCVPDGVAVAPRHGQSQYQFLRIRRAGFDHKSAQGRPAHVGLRAQDHVLQRSGDAGTEQGGRNYDQGPSCV